MCWAYVRPGGGAEGIGALGFRPKAEECGPAEMRQFLSTRMTHINNSCVTLLRNRCVTLASVLGAYEPMSDGKAYYWGEVCSDLDIYVF